MDRSLRDYGGERAETLAAASLAFLAEQPDALGRWLAETGLGPSDLRRAAAERTPDLLAAALDFVRSDEALASAFAEAQGVSAEEMAAARAALPGGDAPHWL